MQVQTYYLEDVLALTENQQSSNQNGRNSEKKLSLTEEDVQSMDEAIQLAWLEDDFETLMDTIEEFPRLNLCNYKHSLTGATALMVSAGKGRVEDVKLLLSLGADISAAANNGHTAFDWAKNNGQEEVVSILTEHMVKVQQAQFQAAETALLQNYQMSADQVRPVKFWTSVFGAPAYQFRDVKLKCFLVLYLGMMCRYLKTSDF